MVRNSVGVVSVSVPCTAGTVAYTWEVNGAIVIRVNLVDHVLELGLAGVLAERAHDGTQLLGGDLACDTAPSVILCANIAGAGSAGYRRAMSWGPRWGQMEETGVASDRGPRRNCGDAECIKENSTHHRRLCPNQANAVSMLFKVHSPARKARQPPVLPCAAAAAAAAARECEDLQTERRPP